MHAHFVTNVTNFGGFQACCTVQNIRKVPMEIIWPVVIFTPDNYFFTWHHCVDLPAVVVVRTKISIITQQSFTTPGIIVGCTQGQTHKGDGIYIRVGHHMDIWTIKGNMDTRTHAHTHTSTQKRGWETQGVNPDCKSISSGLQFHRQEIYCGVQRQWQMTVYETDRSESQTHSTFPSVYVRM